jgi:tape measure domain-containing protein
VADIYTISLEDEASGNAYRIAQAYVEVSIAAKRMRNAVVVGDQALIDASRDIQRLAQNEFRAAKAAQSAANAIAKLGPALKKPDLPKPTKDTWQFSYALNALAQQVTRTAFALAGRLASAAVSAGESLYETADIASRAHLSFANFFGGQAKGDQMLLESIAIAKRYGFEIEGMTKEVNRFGAAGFNTKQSKGLLEFGADMLAAGRTMQDVKGIFLAMTQIQGKGKLQAEELTQQLAERGINAGRVWEILAKKFNTTKDLVMKMQKAGKIGPGAALNAIVQAGVEGVNGHTLGEAGGKVADATVGGLGRRMSTLIESAVFEAVDASTPALTKGMQSLFSGLSAANSKGTLTETLNSIGQGLEKIGPQIPAMVEGFTKAFGAASGFHAENWDMFAKSLPDVAKNLGTIAGFLTTIVEKAIALAGFLGKEGNAQKDLDPVQRYLHNKLFKNTSGLVKETSAAEMTNTLENNKIRTQGDDAIAEEAGKAIANGVKVGIKSEATGVAKAADGLADTAIDAFKDTTQTHSPSKVFAGLGASLSQGVALGVDSNADLASHSARMMADGAIAAAGASGMDPRGAMSAGSAAGSAMSSRSTGLSVRVGDVVLAGGGAAGGSVDAASQVREYFETDFVSMLERHLEGVGA